MRRPSTASPARPGGRTSRDPGFARALLASPGWPELAARLAAEGRRLSGASQAVCVVWSPDGPIAAAPEGARDAAGLPRSGWIAQAARRGQGFAWGGPSAGYLESLPGAKPRRRSLTPAAERARAEDLAWLGVPRAAAGCVLPLSGDLPAPGVLVLLLPRARRWSPDLLSALRALAELAGAAMDALRQRTQLERRARQSAAVSEIAQTITATLEPEILLRLIILEVTKALACQAGDIWLKEEKSLSLLFQTSLGLGPDRRGRALAGAASTQALAAGEPVLASDAADLAEADLEALRAESIVSLAAVPLKVKNKALGVMHLFARRRKTWTREDQLLLKTLANQAATAIENAQLFVETRRKAQELLGLYEVAQVISEMSNLQSALGQIVERVASILEVEKCWFMFWDEHARALVAQHAAVGAVEEQLAALRFGPDAPGVSPGVFRTAKPFYSNAAEEEPAVQAEFRGVFRLSNLMAVPLRSREQTLGVFLAANKREGGTFTGNDVRLFKTLASEATVVIHNANLYDKLRRSYFSIVQVVSDIVDARERYTRGHSERVSAYAALIARRQGLPTEEVECITIAGLLHDLGKMGIAERILLKPGRLNAEEFKSIKHHPEIAERILQNVEMPWNILPLVRHHHERFDGGGYPDGLAGEAIPRGARILAAADAFDVLTTDRVYQKARPLAEAFAELRAHAGRQFDPEVVEALIAAWPEAKLEIKVEWPEEELGSPER
jgi:HD-GYP domain-containing protein (c-di-GMP phosphodiesterase class II)